MKSKWIDKQLPTERTSQTVIHWLFMNLLPNVSPSCSSIFQICVNRSLVGIQPNTSLVGSINNSSQKKKKKCCFHIGSAYFVMYDRNSHNNKMLWKLTIWLSFFSSLFLVYYYLFFALPFFWYIILIQIASSCHIFIFIFLLFIFLSMF